jgi:hypothetical protein
MLDSTRGTAKTTSIPTKKEKKKLRKKNPEGLRPLDAAA